MEAEKEDAEGSLAGTPSWLSPALADRTQSVLSLPHTNKRLQRAEKGIVAWGDPTLTEKREGLSRAAF